MRTQGLTMMMRCFQMQAGTRCCLCCEAFGRCCFSVRSCVVGLFYFDAYLSSMSAITLTTLQILNDRVFPYDGKTYTEWNEIPAKVRHVSPYIAREHVSLGRGGGSAF